MYVLHCDAEYLSRADVQSYLHVNDDYDGDAVDANANASSSSSSSSWSMCNDSVFESWPADDMQRDITHDITRLLLRTTELR